ncbi:GIY-YIG nuclease family protein [Xenorhabdus szentirmaii]
MRKKKADRGGRIYVATDGVKVKVGMSARGKCLGRFAELKRKFGFSVIESFVTERRFDYRLIEKMAHKKLESYWLHNEFFSVPFSDAVNAVIESISDLDSGSFSGSVYQNINRTSCLF